LNYDYSELITIAGGETQGCKEEGKCNECGGFCNGGFCSNEETRYCNTANGDGDGGPPLEAKLNNPTGVAIDYINEIVYFADSGHNRIRKVGMKQKCCGQTNTISHVAGFKNSSAGNGVNDSVDPQETGLNNPLGVVVVGIKYDDDDDDFYTNDIAIFIADTGNHKIRRMYQSCCFEPVGTISTIVNEGGVPTCSTPKENPQGKEEPTRKLLGDEDDSEGEETCKNLESEEGIYSGNATLFSPSNIAVDGENHLYIADRGNKAIRFVREEIIYNLARDIESFGISVPLDVFEIRDTDDYASPPSKIRDTLLVSDNITDTIIRFSEYLPPPPTPSPTG
jgi:hypothetical protein